MNNLYNGRAYVKEFQSTSSIYTKNQKILAHKYGERWINLSKNLRWKHRNCQWCGSFQRPSNIHCLHIGCIEFNPIFIFDDRIILCTCKDCYRLLVPHTKINLTQMLPQLFEN